MLFNIKKENIFFEEIYELYFSKVYKYFAIRTGNIENTEDLTSEVFTKLIKNFKYKEVKKEQLAWWIFKVAHNTLIDYYKKEKNRTITPIENYENTIPIEQNIEQETHYKIAYEMANKLIQYFSKEERDIILLKLTSGLKFSEIASIIGKNENTIKTKYFRNLKIIKSKMWETLLLIILFII